MKSFFKHGLIVCISLLCSCTSKPTYQYIESQSKLINAYREQEYYEYASRLNIEMWEVLKNSDNNLFNKQSLEAIEGVSKIASYEKNILGCYIIPWNNKSFLNDIIMLEWNADAGVVIRFFTKSKTIFEMLPESSY